MPPYYEVHGTYHPLETERCSECAGHGVVSVRIGVEISPGVREYHRGQRACNKCVRLGIIPANYGYIGPEWESVCSRDDHGHIPGEIRTTLPHASRARCYTPVRAA